MDFEGVLELLRGHCEARGAPFALCGGLAMAAYGMGRVTFDVDLAVDASGQDEMVRFLEDHGYTTLYRSVGFSNHRHDDPELGMVDLVWLSGTTSKTVFSSTRAIPGPGNRSWPVVAPEHLAAMKLHALNQDPSRHQDCGDICYLLTLPDVDREEIRRQFARRGLEETFADLARGH